MNVRAPNKGTGLTRVREGMNDHPSHIRAFPHESGLEIVSCALVDAYLRKGHISVRPGVWRLEPLPCLDFVLLQGNTALMPHAGLDTVSEHAGVGCLWRSGIGHGGST